MLCLSLQVSGISRFCLIALPVCPICSFLGCSLQLCLCFPATMRFTPSTRLFAPSSNRLGDPQLKGQPSVYSTWFLPLSHSLFVPACSFSLCSTFSTLQTADCPNLLRAALLPENAFHSYGFSLTSGFLSWSADSFLGKVLFLCLLEFM